jgi:hypothetical protein
LAVGALVGMLSVCTLALWCFGEANSSALAPCSTVTPRRIAATRVTDLLSSLGWWRGLARRASLAAWQGRIVSRREFEVEPTSAGATALTFGAAMDAGATTHQSRDQNHQHQALPSAFSPLEIIPVHVYIGLGSSAR